MNQQTQAGRAAAPVAEVGALTAREVLDLASGCEGQDIDDLIALVRATEAALATRTKAVSQ